MGGFGQRVAVIGLCVLLGGCLDPGNTEAAPADANALNAMLVCEEPAPTVSCTDAHDPSKTLLNVSFPPGQPTALILLDITPEMWIHPSYGWFQAGLPLTPVRDESKWILCVSVRSIGVADGFHFTVIPAWLETDTLRLGVRAWFPAAYTYNDASFAPGPYSSGPPCLADKEAPMNAGGLVSDTPKAGRLALLVAAYADHVALPADLAPIPPPFWLHVGIGRWCSDGPYRPSASTIICLPPPQTLAEPLARAGLAVHATYSDWAAPGKCDRCGFTFLDNTTKADKVRNGDFTAIRHGQVSNGVTFTWGGDGALSGHDGIVYPTGTAAFDASLAADSNLKASCSFDPIGNQWYGFVAQHHRPVTLRTVFTLHGARAFLFDMIEIPIDLDALGLHLEGASSADAGLFIFDGVGNTCGV